MKWSVEKKILIGLGFTTGILVSINALSFWNLKQHKNAAAEIVHTREILEKLETVNSSIVDAETGQRGYLLTGRERYLEPYLASLRKVNLEIQVLRKLTGNNSNQQRRLGLLDALVIEKFAELDQTINLRRDKGLEAAQQLVLTDRGKLLMDRIRTVIREIEREQRTQAEQSVQAVQVEAQRDSFILTTGIILSILLLCFIYNSIKREMEARRQAELTLQKLNTETAEALIKEQEFNKLKSHVVSIISHEYRTPLTTILSSAELLERYSKKLSEEKKFIHFQRIKSAVNHLVDLVDDVVNLSQNEAGEIELKPSYLNLELFCRQLVEELQIQKHSIAFATHGNCPELMIDQKIMRQILTNLFSNSFKYSSEKSTIYFDLQYRDGLTIFQIRDEGIGIPIADQAQLFQPFARGSNVGTISGTGLGLAITKNLVELHGGQIAVDSAVGIGTTFTVTLPLNSKKPALQLA